MVGRGYQHKKSKPKQWLTRGGFGSVIVGGILILLYFFKSSLGDPNFINTTATPSEVVNSPTVQMLPVVAETKTEAPPATLTLLATQPATVTIAPTSTLALTQMPTLISSMTPTVTKTLVLSGTPFAIPVSAITAAPTLLPPVLPAPTPLPVADAVVNVYTLKLHSGPGDNYASSGVLVKNTSLIVTGEIANCTWLKVWTPEKAEGWVPLQAVTLNKSCDQIPAISVLITPVPQGNDGNVVSANGTDGNKPDLVISAFTIESINLNTIQFRYTITNKGTAWVPSSNTAGAKKVAIHVFLSDDQGNPTENGVMLYLPGLDGLAPGQFYTNDYPGTFGVKQRHPDALNHLYLTMVADAEGILDEADETNNRSTTFVLATPETIPTMTSTVAPITKFVTTSEPSTNTPVPANMITPIGIPGETFLSKMITHTAILTTNIRGLQITYNLQGVLGRQMIFTIEAYVPITCSWGFDDGDTTRGCETVHTFLTSGTHLIRMLVSSGSFTELLSTSVRIGPSTVQPPPTKTSSVSLDSLEGMIIDYNKPVESNKFVTFIATVEEAKSNISYTWYFGDGEVVTGGGVIQHVYQNPGNYVVSVFATDKVYTVNYSMLIIVPK